VAEERRPKAKRAKRAPKEPPASHHRREPVLECLPLGNRIREVRKARDISFDALVGLSGLGRGYVSEVERGLAVPSVLTLGKIAEALSVRPGELLAEEAEGDADRARLSAILDELDAEGKAELLRFAERLLLRRRRATP
jgi:transcriptional regulator with XRE-family HTH domain